MVYIFFFFILTRIERVIGVGVGGGVVGYRRDITALVVVAVVEGGLVKTKYCFSSLFVPTVKNCHKTQTKNYT